MTKIRMAGFLVLAMSVEILAIFIGQSQGLSQFTSVGIGLVPALLLLFPVMREWYGGQLRFAVWFLTVAGIAVAGVLVHQLTL